MGQKVNPISLRLGISRKWISNWYAENYGEFLRQDNQIRSYIEKNLTHVGISKVEVERTDNSVKVSIYTARPGIIIGKKG